MATYTGNTRNVTDSVEIPTAILGFSTTALRKLFAGD